MVDESGGINQERKEGVVSEEQLEEYATGLIHDNFGSEVKRGWRDPSVQNAVREGIGERATILKDRVVIGDSGLLKTKEAAYSERRRDLARQIHPTEGERLLVRLDTIQDGIIDHLTEQGGITTTKAVNLASKALTNALNDFFLVPAEGSEGK